MIKLGLGLSMAALMALGCGDDDTTDDGAGVDAGDGAADAGAETTFDVALTADDEVPLCAAAGDDATGEATVTINEDSSEVSVEASWSGLSGDATAAHVHFGATGDAGGVIFPLGMPPTIPVSETFTASDYPAEPPVGAPADFAAFVTAMEAGMSYVNVHTVLCESGEIRGQISN